MPIILDGSITIGRRANGEAVLDVFPPFRYGPPVRTPHVEARTLPEALRKLADVFEEQNAHAEGKT